jgi:hypothetical protein
MQLSDFAECPDKQEQGSPLYLDDGFICVKRIHTVEYNKQRESIRNSIYGFSPNDVDENLITGHWLAECGVTGWNGVLDGDKELEFTRENARAVFLNPNYKLSLNALLINHAANYANYLFDEVKEDIEAAKKS